MTLVLQPTISASARCVVLGGGGHAAVLIDALLLSGVNVAAVVDADPSRAGTTLFDVPIVGDDRHLPLLRRQGVSHFVVGLGSTARGDTSLRTQLFHLARSHGLEPLAVVHPRACVSPRCTLGAGVQLLAQAVVQPRAQLGNHVLVNTAAVVEHDCQVGDQVHLAPGSLLCGGVQVGSGAHLGAGAVVRQGIKIGARAVVGAGSVVVADVPPGAVVVGVPARPHPRELRAAG